MRRTHLRAISAFVDVAREGNFSRAARRLGVSPSALSQLVRSLEASIGVRLLNRTTRSTSLTAEGRKFLERVEPGLALIAQAVDAMAGSNEAPSGRVRVATSRIAARLLIEPRLAEFHRAFPRVELEIIIDDAFTDIVREGCDLGVRLRESVPAGMIAIPIAPPAALAVVGAPAYFARRSRPRTPRDLDEHVRLAFLHGVKRVPTPWEFVDPITGAQVMVAPTAEFVTNADDLLIGAALQGVGLAMHLHGAVRAEIERGRLIRVLEDWTPPFDGFTLYLATRKQMPPKTRAFVDFMSDRRAWPSG